MTENLMDMAAEAISTPARLTRSKSDIPASRSITKRPGKKALRPWRRLAGRFQQQRHDDFHANLHDEPSQSMNEPETLVESAVNSFRQLTSNSKLNPVPERKRADTPASRRIPQEEGRNTVVQTEVYLRHVFFIAFSYTCGVLYPQAFPFIRKAAEYSLVGLLTCWGILAATAWGKKNKPRQASSEASQERVTSTSWGKVHSADDLQLLYEDDQTPLVRNSRQEDTKLEKEDSGTESCQTSPRTRTPLVCPDVSVHPALEPYFVIDTATGQRVFPNTSTPLSMNTDYFEGQMMVLIRTPNVDDPSQPPGTPENAACCKYMADKQRRFEFQFQIKLKKLPTGRVYFACELEETVRMGMVQRAFVSAAMAFVRTTNSTFHYSITGNPYSADGKYEKPHMAFPVEEGMNRVVATPPGQPLPVLGGEIFEDPESIKRRKKGLTIEWNLQDTYTVSLWSAYVDFLEWHACNLPGIRPFNLVNVIGPQPIYLTLYEIPKENDKDKHNRCDMINIAEFEMSNTKKSGAGAAAKQWLSLYGNGSMERGQKVVDKLPQEQEEDYRDEDELTGGVEDAQEEDEDEDAAAELGEGIYVRSGDVIYLRESVPDAENSEPARYVVNGGGFAVLQEKNFASIVIEKAGRRRSRSNSVHSGLIKIGDTVIIKLVQSGTQGGEKEVKYLALHRGWWLKWGTAAPTKNGFFTIHQNESAVREERNDNTVLSNDTESAYLTLGGSFSLRHKRWSKYLVGVCREGSATYGGRMLGLFDPTKEKGSMGFNTDEDEGMLDEIPTTEPKEGERSIRPLYLEVCDTPKLLDGPGLLIRSSTDEADKAEDKRQLLFSCDDLHMDAPAWLEVMNRSERVRQLVFVIRVVASSGNPEQPDGEDGTRASAERSGSGPERFFRLRTGRDLSGVMRAGLAWRNTKSSFQRKRSDKDLTMPVSPTSGSKRDLATNSPSEDFVAQRNSFEEPGDANADSDSGSDDFFPDSADEIELQSFCDEVESVAEDVPSRSKGRKLIGKIARSVKEKTATTGKKVVRQSFKVGKGTVNAGKAIINARPWQPPSKEPRTAKYRSRKQVERDLDVDLDVSVRNRSIKRVERVESRLLEADDPASVLAGELSAPEQSCRTVSNMLARMSSVPANSSVAAKFSPLLASLVEQRSQYDNTFLQGGSVELGVKPGKDSVYDCLVARCLWESHWREEWCGVQKRAIVFYAPLTKEPCLEISFKDIQRVRLVGPGSRSPLPGFSILAVETAWSCHYVGLLSDDARENLKSKLEIAVSAFNSSEDTKSVRESELWKARLWQGLQDSLESSLSSGRGKWADVVAGQKKCRRVVLNSRRMFFDLLPPTGDTHTFVEDLLSTSLSFSLDSLQHRPEFFSQFLDSTSMLRGLLLQRLNRSDTATFCIFVNLYHCLLQHALLLTPNGPLQKRSCEEFMRTCCYEIGGHVFSLAELSCCIIRGNMSRPIPPKAPYIEAPKKSAAFRFFALSTFSPNTTFLVNTGDVSCPNEVPVLRPDHLEEQIARQTAEFLKRNLTVDVAKRLVVLPKVCEVYRNDFAADLPGSANACLRYCLRFLDEPIAIKIHGLLADEANLTIRYQPVAEQYHTRLSRRMDNFQDSPREQSR